ncbi:MAG: septal ring lytic transglycosylase RlpA family protein [Proteobacteria bacterium]|nr:septal ring lytic transglycosylase RlpA family protein [Pseudomonadota bacterium]
MRLYVLALSALAFMLSSCTELQLATHFTKEALDEPAPYNAPAITGARKVGKPYQVEGLWYYPLEDSTGYSAKGIASWYGKEFHGKKTANGETYNMYDLTAAHPTLPLPTYVRVTNLNNGKSIIVKVNDRGPFLRGRVIDMSYRSAQLLGYVEQGTAPVLLEALPADGTIMLANQRPEEVPFKKYGHTTKQAAAEAQLTRPARFTERVSQQPVTQTVTEEEAPPLPSTQIATVEKVRIFVQTGSFGDKSNAEHQRSKLAHMFTNSYVSPAEVKGKTFYRVRIGPVENVEMADQVLARAVHEGYKQAIIVVD